VDAGQLSPRAHLARRPGAVLTLLGFGEKDFQLYRRRTREEAWPAAIGFIEEIRDEVERRGARFAIFDVPRFKWRSRLERVEDYAFIALDRELEAYCRERDIPYRSILPALAGRDIRPLRMSAGDIHFNRSGHALVADEFASFVETILREDG
jgi:lysophospholipase L1-like esterase